MTNPIGIFDSGIGGLTVFQKLCSLLPQENLVYLGDSARLPYGDKSPESILRYTQMGASFLCKFKIKLLLLACHTASAHALPFLQKELPIPVLGVVQPGFDLLMAATHSKRVAILGTASTIASGVYQKLIQGKATLIPIACPLFVPLVEEQLFDHEVASLIVQHYLRPLQEAQIDAVLLACTHYPFLRKAIQKVLGPSVAILEPAVECAKQVKDLLAKKHLLNDQRKGSHRFYVTDHPDRFLALAQILLKEKIEKVDLVQLDEKF